MDNQIQTNHMKSRCYFISAMCGISIYSWTNYSLFDPITNHFMTIYYQNRLLFLFYLLWDTYHMTLSEKRIVLYRKDLVIHHIISFIITISSVNNCSLVASNYMIMECISLMNHVWKNNPQLLKFYRTMCILLVRMPLSFWFWLYYNPNYLYVHLKQTMTPNHYYYFYTIIGKVYIFFILYDMLILWKLHKPAKIKQ
jgi:hypothetical protein